MDNLADKKMELLFPSSARKALYRGRCQSIVPPTSTYGACLRRGCAAEMLWIAEDGTNKSFKQSNGHPLWNCSGTPGDCGCPHAELRCLLHHETKDARDAVLLVTLSPCAACAWAIVHDDPRRIHSVFFLTEYDKDPRGTRILQRFGIRAEVL